MLCRRLVVLVVLVGVGVFTRPYLALGFTLEQALIWISENREYFTIVSDKIGVDVGDAADIWLGQLDDDEQEDPVIAWDEGAMGIPDLEASEESIFSYDVPNPDAVDPDKITTYSAYKTTDGIANAKLSSSGQAQMEQKSLQTVESATTVQVLGQLAQTSTVSQDILKILALQNVEMAKMAALEQQDATQKEISDSLNLKVIGKTAKMVFEAEQKISAKDWGGIFNSVSAFNYVGPIK